MEAKSGYGLDTETELRFAHNAVGAGAVQGLPSLG